MSLSASRPAELVLALRHDNMFWRMTSQRLLVERGETDVLPQLVAMINDRSVDRLGLNPGALHALWTLHGLGALDGSNAVAIDAAKGALSHPAAGVRKAAMAVLPKSTQSLVTLLAAGVLEDADLNVRLNALLAVSEMPASIEAGRAIYALSTQRDVIDDEWLPEAVWVAATKHQDGFHRAYIDDIGPVDFARISVRGARGERAGAVDWSASAQDETGWMTLAAPRVWAETPIGDFVGTVWLRRTIDIPAAVAGRPAQIRLGIVDDTDVTYVNGTRINATTNMRNAPRQYSIPAGVLVAGRNVVAVRISNVNGRGGFAPDPPAAPGVPILQPQAGTPELAGMVIAGDGFNVPLAGEWRAKIEETWDGGRRREVLTSAPIAQQILLANSPVADLFTATAAGTRGMPASVAATPGSGTAASTTSAGNDARRITLGVTPGEMKFDTALLTVRAGERVDLAFNNTDDMPHNVVIFKRGDIAAYEPELFGSMNEPFAQQRGFVPDSPNVLFATRLLNARESTVLSFEAPKEPGDYPFVCSFPGHWLLMRGVLRVE